METITGTQLINLLDENRESLNSEVRSKIEAQEQECDKAMDSVLEGAPTEGWEAECAKLEEMVKAAFKLDNFKSV